MIIPEHSNMLQMRKTEEKEALHTGSRYVFLTGATGMLGSYFLRNLSADGYHVVVLARHSRNRTARQRIESLMVKWEKELGRTLPRPVVIDGDLTGNEWLDSWSEWFRSHVDTVIHSAASLEFYGAPEGEPYQSNVYGLKTILELCRRANIRKFHHVSTAYVAGTSRVFYESNCDEGQEFRNDYEKSKIEAERLVRSFGFDSLTVYRPSVVIGDTRTGYTATFSGLYAALKLVHTLVSCMSLGSTSSRAVLESIGLDGTECKNLVPVDWVADVFRHVFNHPELHGQTYHLTTPKPPLIRDVAITIQDAVEAYSEMMPEDDTTRRNEAWFATNFSGQMQLFDAYLNHDPYFDSTNTQTAAPHLPCPDITHDLLMFLFHAAIESSFGKKYPYQGTPNYDVQEFLTSRWGNLTSAPICSGHEVGLYVNGAGGGQWELDIHHGIITQIKAGISPTTTAMIELDADTFRKLTCDELSIWKALTTKKLRSLCARDALLSLFGLTEATQIESNRVFPVMADIAATLVTE